MNCCGLDRRAPPFPPTLKLFPGSLYVAFCSLINVSLASLPRGADLRANTTPPVSRACARACKLQIFLSKHRLKPLQRIQRTVRSPVHVCTSPGGSHAQVRGVMAGPSPIYVEFVPSVVLHMPSSPAEAFGYRFWNLPFY